LKIFFGDRKFIINVTNPPAREYRQKPVFLFLEFCSSENEILSFVAEIIKTITTQGNMIENILDFWILLKL